MNMREQMAKAAFERMMKIMAELYPAGALGGVIVDERWETTSAKTRENWLLAQDAALDAMLHPTEEMIDAGVYAMGRNNLRDGWDAIIRAARDGK